MANVFWDEKIIIFINLFERGHEYYWRKYYALNVMQFKCIKKKKRPCLAEINNLPRKCTSIFDNRSNSYN